VRSYLQIADFAIGEDVEGFVGEKSLSVALPLEGRRRFALC